MNLFLGNLRRQVDVGYCTVVMRNGSLVLKGNLELGSISGTMAELWALKMAFSLARQLNLENINLELDAGVLVYMLFSLSSVNLMSETLLTDFRNLMRSLLTAQWLIFIGKPGWQSDSFAKIGVVKITEFFLFFFEWPMTHRLWGKVCWLLIKLSFFVIHLLFLNIMILFNPKKKKIYLKFI